jgi:hypothetical protein
MSFGSFRSPGSRAAQSWVKVKNSLPLLIPFGSPYPQPSEWQRIGNQSDAAMIFPRADFVSVL